MKTPLAVIITLVVAMVGFVIVYSQTGLPEKPAVAEAGHAAAGGYGGGAAPSGGYGGAAPSGGYGGGAAPSGGYGGGAAEPSGGYGAGAAPSGGYGGGAAPSGGYGGGASSGEQGGYIYWNGSEWVKGIPPAEK